MESQGTPQKVRAADREAGLHIGSGSSSDGDGGVFHTPTRTPAKRFTSSPAVTTEGGSSSSSAANSSGTCTPSESSLSDVEWESPCRGRPVQTLAAPLLTITQSAEQLEPVYWEAMVVLIPMFSAYASLIGLQHAIKFAMEIPDDSSAASHDFGVATSFVYMSNLLVRLLHNVVFCCLTARQRVFLSMASMVLSLAVIVVLLEYVQFRKVYWVAFAYTLGGIGLGTFEGNFLNCLTPLGQRTKRLAIAGIPLGMSAVFVGGFFAMAPPISIQPSRIYMAVILGVIIGMVCMHFRIPDRPTQGDESSAPSTPLSIVPRRRRRTLAKLMSDVEQFREWGPLLALYPLASTVDMFALSCFTPGIVMMMYDQPTVTLAENWVMRTEIFLAIFNVASLIGGFVGRISSFSVRPRHPICYTVLSAFGILLILLQIPLIAPIGALFIMLGDGLIYGTISRHIDTRVPREFNLIAISCWLCIGDLGSVIGGNLMSYIRDWIVGN